MFIYYSCFIHSSVDGRLGCFNVLTTVNNAAMNTGVHMSFSIFFPSGYIPTSEIAGSYGGLSSVSLLCPTICDPMNRSMPGLPVHHQLPEFTQIHLQRVSDAISHLILCSPLLLLPRIPPSIRVFNESALRMRWPKYWTFSFSIIPSKEIPGLISFRMDQAEWTGWISLQSKGLSKAFSNTTVQKHQFFGTQPSSQSNSHIHT